MQVAVAQIRSALAIAFSPRYAWALALCGGLAMFALLVWSGGFVVHYSTGDWDFYASPSETLTMLVLAVLFGLLAPLQVAAVVKARSAAGTTGGVLGTVFGVLSMSCCAPLIAPALLSFVGFSGMAILQVNVAVHEWATVFAVASIAFMVLAIALVSHTLVAACRLSPSRSDVQGSSGGR